MIICGWLKTVHNEVGGENDIHMPLQFSRVTIFMVFLFLVDRFYYVKILLGKTTCDGVPSYYNTSRCFDDVPFPNLSHGNISL
jgi:hypothetical protein